MIDIENKVITEVTNAVHAQYPGITVASDYEEYFATFPAVAIYQVNNELYQKSLDGTLTEHHAKVTFEVNVYANDQFNRKGTCMDILQIVDACMLGMRFVRTYTRRVPNIDRSVYRMYARYKAVVEEGKTENGVTTHQMYRR